MNEECNKDVNEVSKRGRKKRENGQEEVMNEEVLEQILKMLKDVNNKPYGKEITFKDLAVYAIPKLLSKDLEKIQESSLNDMERVQRLLDEHNEKNKTNLSLGEFLVKKLNI